MEKIYPCLWFDNQAEQAARFYVSIFKGSKIVRISHYGEAAAEASGQKKGGVLTVLFLLNGRHLLALNGGPAFRFSPAISLVVSCKNQKEIDWFWEELSKGGEPGQCGWLTDKFGVSWQIVPDVLQKYVCDPNPARSERVMAELMTMKKLEVATLNRAYRKK